MMRRTRVREAVDRAALVVSCARLPVVRGARFFPPFLDFANVFARAAWLATFWGPSVTYCPNITSSAHRSVRWGSDRTVHHEISEE
jgi:hypothetical protein